MGLMDGLKAVDLRELTKDELQLKLEDLQEEHFNLRVQASVAQLESPTRIRLVRRAIARVKTIQRERELQQERDRG